MYVTEGGYIELSRLDPTLAGHPFPYFQPIVSIEDRRVVGYEVLARGRDAQGNITSLGYMFEKYADSRVAIELDLYIRDLAFKQYSESQIAFGKRLFVNTQNQFFYRRINNLGYISSVAPFYLLP